MDAGYVQRTLGEVLWIPPGDEDGDGDEVGSFTALHLRCGDMDEEPFNPRMWAEAEDAELGEIASALYTEDGEWTEAFESLWAEVDCRDLLVIRDLMLEDGHRGNGLSTRIVRRIIEVVGYSCGVAAIIPLPVSTHSMSSQQVRVVSQKLATRFESMGFERVPDTAVWAMSLEHEVDVDPN